EWANRWVSLDVTQTLREWLHEAGEEQGFQLKLPCDCGKPMEEFLFGIAVYSIHYIEINSSHKFSAKTSTVNLLTDRWQCFIR
ncbi:unnamed protein product, partial [Coregonus sp. 'balchen']